MRVGKTHRGWTMNCDFNRDRMNVVWLMEKQAVSWQNSEPEKSEFMGSQNTNRSWKRGKGGKELESRVLFK